jgi:signal transduction histidine kinase
MFGRFAFGVISIGKNTKINLSRLSVIIIFLILVLCYSLSLIAQENNGSVNALLDSARVKGKSLQDIRKLSENALSLAKKLNYEQGIADAQNLLGKSLLKLGEYPKALNCFFYELELREDNPDWGNSSIAYVDALIGESYRSVFNYNLAIEYLQKSLLLLDKNDDKKVRAFVYDRLAAVYDEITYKRIDSSAYEKTMDYAQKSSAIANEINDMDLKISTLNIMGAASTFTGNYNASLDYFNLALSECDGDSTNTDRANILNNIAYVYKSQNDYKTSIEYALESHHIAEKFGIKIYILESARSLSDAYYKLGDFESAFKYLTEANDVYFNLFDERKTAEINTLQKNYEAALKIQDKKANTLTRIIFGVSLSLIFIAVGFVAYFRHRNQLLLNYELAKKNELISDQKEKLTQSNIAKDKFLSIISHDLKNPLHGILGFASFMSSEFDILSDKEKKEYISYIKASSESMNKLIEGILTWSRLQTGKMKIQKEKVNISEVVRHVVELQKVNGIRKGVLIENNILDELNVFADKNVLDTVMRNLIDNAIKFTEEGGKITLSARIKEENHIEISVADTGVGMNKEDISRLFHIENRFMSEGTNKEKGTGMGLILCKDMLHLISSDLNVESYPDEGTRFYFTLPLI